MPSPAQKAKRLADLHRRRKTFIIPNPWDKGSARLLAQAGFQALATTGAGCAFSRGMANGRPGSDAILENAADIVGVTDLPVSADLENGFGHGPEAVAETIRLAIGVGLAGGSIEDGTYGLDQPVYEIGLASERIRAAAEAIRNRSVPFQLVARAENFLCGRPDLADTIRRLQAFQEAGADVLYAPGLTTAEQIRAVVTSVDRPVNVVMGLVGSNFTLDQLADMGVTRISVGSALARSAYAAVARAAKEMAEAGAFTFAEAAIPFGELDATFRA